MTETKSIKDILYEIEKKIEFAVAKKSQGERQHTPRLVAVSKTKPIEMVIEAYNAGQRHFGENYPQELCAKAHDPKILKECPDIQWHFIGHLQTNKISKLVDIPNLYAIQTVDSEKVARGINAHIQENYRYTNRKLKVFVQINTSGEKNKFGVKPDEALPLTELIINECPNLEFAGVMTIGKFGHDLSTGPNPDYLILTDTHKLICQEMNWNRNDIDISMGMSDDFEHAIELGSTIVRIGSSIFGQREKKDN